MKQREVYKTEAGQGGKKGHSNMSHWEYTEIIKARSRKLRRRRSRAMEFEAKAGGDIMD